jgi:hypothetical protein
MSGADNGRPLRHQSGEGIHRQPLFPTSLERTGRDGGSDADMASPRTIDDTRDQLSFSRLPVTGKQVTVRLDPSQPFHPIQRVQSAHCRHRINRSGGDTAAQNRLGAAAV